MHALQDFWTANTSGDELFGRSRSLAGTGVEYTPFNEEEPGIEIAKAMTWPL